MGNKCPRCSVKLTRLAYEGIVVHRCDQCFGYLVGRERLAAIKQRRTRPVAELKEEVLDEGHADTQAVLRCPACHKRMQKRPLKPPASLTLDLCEACGLVWLDGGELARLQLAHRISPQGVEAAELQRRYREMGPQRRAQLEANIARLPEELPENEQQGIEVWGLDLDRLAKKLWDFGTR